MDYKEKYEAIVGWLKKYADEGMNITPSDIRISVPELAESEDERIRKGLIELVSDIPGGFPFEKRGIIKKEALAYLEKQKPSAEEVLIKAGLKPYKDGNQWCILIGDNIQEGICGFGDTIDDALYHLLREAIAYQKEQKPVEKPKWYDSMDEFYADALIEMVEKSDLIDRDKNNRLVWIEKHRQNPAEWSEEDERIRQRLIKDLENAETDDEDVQKELNEDVAWLKSLHPSWKPSEEQIEALTKLLTVGDLTYPGQMSTLIKLKDDLKKLNDESTSKIL